MHKEERLDSIRKIRYAIVKLEVLELKLYLIRHGETNWNKELKIQGSSDIELNEYGRELAFMTRDGLRHVPFDIGYTSPLKRAKETGEIILGGKNVPLYEDNRIKEACFGRFEGATMKELKDKHDPFLKFFDAPEEFEPIEGCETHQDVINRSADFFNDMILPNERKYQHVAVFSHGAWIHSLLTYIYKRDISEFWHAPRQENCGVTTIEITNGVCNVLKESEIFYNKDGE